MTQVQKHRKDVKVIDKEKVQCVSTQRREVKYYSHMQICQNLTGFVPISIKNHNDEQIGGSKYREGK